MRLDTMAAETLTQSLRPAAVDVSRLGREYMPLLQLVRLLIGATIWTITTLAGAESGVAPASKPTVASMGVTTPASPPCA